MVDETLGEIPHGPARRAAGSRMIDKDFDPLAQSPQTTGEQKLVVGCWLRLVFI